MMKQESKNPAVLISCIFFLHEFTTLTNNIKYNLAKLETLDLNICQELSFLRLKEMIEANYNDKNQFGSQINSLTSNRVHIINEKLMLKLGNACASYSSLW
jgi:ribosome-binding ATPase YchF (GTP1/OBG family)